MNKAEKLIDYIMDCALRPKRGARIELIKAILNFIIEEYSYKEIEDTPFYSSDAKIIDVEDIEDLLKQLETMVD